MKLREQPGQLGVAVTGPDQLSGVLLQLLQRSRALVFDLELETAELTESLNRRRIERRDNGAGNREKRPSHAVYVRLRAVRLAGTLPKGLQVDENHGVIRRGPGKTETGDGKNVRSLRAGATEWPPPDGRCSTCIPVTRPRAPAPES